MSFSDSSGYAITYKYPEFGEKAKLKAGDILVVGCSTSEIIGDKIGTNSNPETAQTVLRKLQKLTIVL